MSLCFLISLTGQLLGSYHYLLTNTIGWLYPIVFLSNVSPVLYQVVVFGRLIKWKILELLFNFHLSFDNHIASIIAKAKQRIYLLKKYFIYCNSLVVINGFKTYVLPILEYCSPVWSPSALGDILRSESVQRSFTKSLPDYNSLTYVEKLGKSGLRSLELRRLCADLILMYKIIHKLIECDLLKALTFVTNRTRGNSYKIQHLPARLNVRLNCYTNS